jgi:CubicO group peptidase (beta-lactamase class C family)
VNFLPLRTKPILSLVLATALICAAWHTPSRATESMQERIEALIPKLEAYIDSGMKDFDLPGLAIGIVADDKLVYAKGFGVRAKGGASVDTKTVFQIGSATKAFLATTMAIAVDKGKMKWDDRVIDLDPAFQLKDPWVTREFRVFDMIAQRSGLPPHANDTFGLLGFDEAKLIRSLRDVDPVTSFRTTFAYTNVTHMLAGRVVADKMEASDWNAVLQKELLDPLGMKDSSYSAAAIEAAPNHAAGYLWSPSGTTEVPFTQIFPYDFGGAGNINSTVEDLAHWVRLQLGKGSFDGRRVVSEENLTVTRIPKVAISDRASYAQGWVIVQSDNGTIVWHNGGTTAFGAMIGLLPDKNVGVIVLSNQNNIGLPDAVGLWTLDRLLDNPEVDHAAAALKNAKANFERQTKLFAKPDKPRPFPPLTPLTGKFANPSFGQAVVTGEGDALLMELLGSGAVLKLEPWDGNVFTFALQPIGEFAAMVQNSGPLPNGFAEFQMGPDGKPNLLRLSFDDGQTYVFSRE